MTTTELKPLKTEYCCMDEDGCTDRDIVKKVNQIIAYINDNIANVNIVKCNACIHRGECLMEAWLNNVEAKDKFCCAGSKDGEKE